VRVSSTISLIWILNSWSLSEIVLQVTVVTMTLLTLFLISHSFIQHFSAPQEEGWWPLVCVEKWSGDWLLLQTHACCIYHPHITCQALWCLICANSFTCHNSELATYLGLWPFRGQCHIYPTFHHAVLFFCGLVTHGHICILFLSFVALMALISTYNDGLHR
jgi:hypothetical protein